MIDQLLISPRCVTKDIYHFPNSSPWGEIIRCTLESNFHGEGGGGGGLGERTRREPGAARSRSVCRTLIGTLT